MSKFYGAGYQPPKRKVQPAVTNVPPKAPSAAPKLVLRFVLKSGAALELIEDSVEEVVGGWADQMCRAIAGVRPDGSKVLIPVSGIDYVEDAT